MVDVGEGDARLAQAIVDRVERQLPSRERHGALGMLDVREALVLGRGDDEAVDHHGRGRVVIGGVDAQRVSSFGLGKVAMPRPVAAALGPRSRSIAAAATASGSTRRRQSW